MPMGHIAHLSNNGHYEIRFKIKITYNYKKKISLPGSFILEKSHTHTNNMNSCREEVIPEKP